MEKSNYEECIYYSEISKKICFLEMLIMEFQIIVDTVYWDDMNLNCL
jgi:hypothetical protein